MLKESSCSTFIELAQRLGPRIDAALEARTRLGEGCPVPLREAMCYSLLAPGKRLRPMLVLLAAEACGGQIEPAMPAACAVEMVHAYSLIHDDLPALDDDDLRRGRPTCHKAFGEATAILAGDALLTLAFEVLAKEIRPPAVAAACCATLAEAAGPCGMVGGQADDVGDGTRQDAVNPHSGSPVPRPPFPVPQLESIHRRKTGAMIRASLRLGAMVAGADAEQLDALSAYGERLGLAFQITDDLLDVLGSQSAVGKPVGKDARRGKLTFPGVIGIDRSSQYAEQLIFEAREALTRFGTAAEGLEMLARYVLERNR
jgi:geranylgeranyl diphosphate synthase, type II